MPDSSQPTGLLAAHRSCTGRADELARRYHIPLLNEAPRSGFFLRLDQHTLQLLQADAGNTGPVQVDFVTGALAHRRRFGGGRGQPLARAAGMKRGLSPSIWDATAGLGRDAFVLASLGSRVTLCERSAVLAALLEQGLQQATVDPDIGDWIGQRMHLVHGDSARLLAALPAAKRPEVVYLDPMYPPGKTAVLVKKDMRALQQLLGHDHDSGQLMETALATASRRVVVKRPRKAGWLHERRPDTCIESKKTRYDVYITGLKPTGS